MSLTESMVVESLKKLIDPNTDKSLVDTKSIKSINFLTSQRHLGKIASRALEASKPLKDIYKADHYFLQRSHQQPNLPKRNPS